MTSTYFSHLKSVQLKAILSGILAIVPHAFASQKGHHEHTHGKHVHGAGELTIAFNGPQSLQVELKVPAETVIGFEHKAKNEKEQAKVQSALDELKKTILLFVVPSEKAQCSAVDVSTRIEYESSESGDASHHAAKKEKHGEHSEVYASFGFNCQASLKGQELKIIPRAISSKLHAVDVIIIGDSAQTSAKIKKSGDSLKLPN